jgi:hypothetical protein
MERTWPGYLQAGFMAISDSERPTSDMADLEIVQGMFVLASDQK